MGRVLCAEPALDIDMTGRMTMTGALQGEKGALAHWRTAGRDRRPGVAAGRDGRLRACAPTRTKLVAAIEEVFSTVLHTCSSCCRMRTCVHAHGHAHVSIMRTSMRTCQCVPAQRASRVAQAHGQGQAQAQPGNEREPLSRKLAQCGYSTRTK